MCRNIKTLFNFDPPATDEEIRAAALQFVRKLSGFNSPSKANQATFDRAIDDVVSRPTLSHCAQNKGWRCERSTTGGVFPVGVASSARSTQPPPMAL